MAESSLSESKQVVIAGRLAIPSHSEALLWDMDGVLLDTLSLDYEIVDDVLRKHAPRHRGVSPAFIRARFAYDAAAFWRQILASDGVRLHDDQFDDLVADYEDLRRSSLPGVHAGVTEVLAEARRLALRTAVVSNNAEADVKQMLTNAALLPYFDEVVGNDKEGLAKKPAPDTYLEACGRLGVEPSRCVVIEDSLLGAEAGSRAGCFTVGVATGANTLDELARSPYVSFSLAGFGPPTAGAPIRSEANHSMAQQGRAT